MGGDLAHFPFDFPTSQMCWSAHKCKEKNKLSTDTKVNANDKVTAEI